MTQDIFGDEEAMQQTLADANIADLTEEELLSKMIEEDWDPDESDTPPLLPEQLVLPLLVPPTEPYHPRDHDRAIREATLAPGTSWRERSGLLSYLATNNIEVSFGSADLPLDLAAARKEISKLGESTVIVGRLFLLLWNVRHKKMTRRKGGSVPVLISEVLRLMGNAKHTKARQTGSSLQYTDGYRPEQKRRIIQDAALLSAFQVRARIIEDGQLTPLNILGQYLKCSLVSKEIGGVHKIVGFYVEPGDWIKAYDALPEHPADAALARIDAAICQLDTQNDKYAIRIALSLTEKWRDQVVAYQAAQLRGDAIATDLGAPMKMRDLLASSMITPPREHVRDRFIPRVERAIQILISPPPDPHKPPPEQRCVISDAQPQVEVDRQQDHWEQAWLDMPWSILPPPDLLNACPRIIEATLPLLSEKKERKTRKKK